MPLGLHDMKSERDYLLAASTETEAMPQAAVRLAARKSRKKNIRKSRSRYDLPANWS